MKKDYKNIFEKMKAKSIGINKRVKNKRIKIKATLKRSIATFLTILAASSMVGCNVKNNEKHSTKSSTSYSMDKEWNGYTYDEITNYELKRLDETLSSNGLTEYEMKGGNRVYNYTAQDYGKVPEFNDSYVRSFYIMTDSNTVDQFCMSQGYQDFTDYMDKNGYINSDGSKDISKWYDDSLEAVSKKMSFREVGKTK